MPTTYQNPNRALQENVKLPTMTEPVDVSQLGSTTPFTIPPAPVLSPYDISTLPTLDSLFNAPKTATEVAQDALGDKALTDVAKLGTRSAAQARAETDAGVPEFNKQLNDINFQIRDLQAQSASAYNASEDRLAPTFAIRGEQAQIERQRSVKALGLSAIAQAIQGNIALAKDKADRAVEEEFAPIQAELDTVREALSMNEKKLSREDAKRAQAQQIALQERQRVLDQAKENKTIIYGWAAEAAKNGASSLLINRAIGVTDPMQALQILAPFMSDPNAKAQALAQLEATRANTAATYASIENTKANAAKTRAETAQTTNAKANLLSLVGQYRDLVSNSNWFTANFDPNTKAQLDSLRGQITAIYKQQQQLGTLDAGVQKLIDTIFPASTGFGVVQLSPSAQASAIDNFVKNQGGAASSNRIRVKLNATGQTGTIDASEFDAKTMTKL